MLISATDLSATATGTFTNDKLNKTLAASETISHKLRFKSPNKRQPFPHSCYRSDNFLKELRKFEHIRTIRTKND